MSQLDEQGQPAGHERWPASGVPAQAPAPTGYGAHNAYGFGAQAPEPVVPAAPAPSGYADRVPSGHTIPAGGALPTGYGAPAAPPAGYAAPVPQPPVNAVPPAVLAPPTGAPAAVAPPAAPAPAAAPTGYGASAARVMPDLNAPFTYGAGVTPTAHVPVVGYGAAAPAFDDDWDDEPMEVVAPAPVAAAPAAPVVPAEPVVLPTAALPSATATGELIRSEPPMPVAPPAPAAPAAPAVSGYAARAAQLGIRNTVAFDGQAFVAEVPYETVSRGQIDDLVAGEGRVDAPVVPTPAPSLVDPELLAAPAVPSLVDPDLFDDPDLAPTPAASAPSLTDLVESYVPPATDVPPLTEAALDAVPLPTPTSPLDSGWQNAAFDWSAPEPAAVVEAAPAVAPVDASAPAVPPAPRSADYGVPGASVTATVGGELRQELPTGAVLLPPAIPPMPATVQPAHFEVEPELYASLPKAPVVPPMPDPDLYATVPPSAWRGDAAELAPVDEPVEPEPVDEPVEPASVVEPTSAVESVSVVEPVEPPAAPVAVATPDAALAAPAPFQAPGDFPPPAPASAAAFAPPVAEDLVHEPSSYPAPTGWGAPAAPTAVAPDAWAAAAAPEAPAAAWPAPAPAAPTAPAVTGPTGDPAIDAWIAAQSAPQVASAHPVPTEPTYQAPAEPVVPEAAAAPAPSAAAPVPQAPAEPTLPTGYGVPAVPPVALPASSLPPVALPAPSLPPVSAALPAVVLPVTGAAPAVPAPAAPTSPQHVEPEPEAWAAPTANPYSPPTPQTYAPVAPEHDIVAPTSVAIDLPAPAAEQASTFIDADGAGAVESLRAALQKVVSSRASDLHISAGAPPMIRIDGALRPLEGAPVWSASDVEHVLRGIMNPSQRARFDEHLELDFAYGLSAEARFRVNVYQQREKMGAAFRLIPTEIKTLKQLGVPTSIAKFAALPRGLVLVTGPTGSGKSTTLAGLIDLANETRADHIMTVEDPIEFMHNNKRSLVNQREVGADTHSFTAALKHVLRQDPDIILVGELRDLETISTALTAAETGHLVFATLHTQSAPQTVDRIIDVFPPHQQGQVRAQLASTLQGVVCQTLVPRASGTGRVVATEVMFTNSAIGNLIREGKTYQITTAMQAGRDAGMHTMDQHLADLVNAGLVKYEDALAKVQEIEEFNRLVHRMESMDQRGFSTGIDFGDKFSGTKREI